MKRKTQPRRLPKVITWLLARRDGGGLRDADGAARSNAAKVIGCRPSKFKCANSKMRISGCGCRKLNWNLISGCVRWRPVMAWDRRLLAV